VRSHKSNTGKCSENGAPIKIYNGNFICAHKEAEENTYEKVTEEMDSYIATVFNRVKKFHDGNHINSELAKNLS
jgi:hypothetical protein